MWKWSLLAGWLFDPISGWFYFAFDRNRWLSSGWMPYGFCVNNESNSSRLFVTRKENYQVFAVSRSKGRTNLTTSVIWIFRIWCGFSWHFSFGKPHTKYSFRFLLNDFYLSASVESAPPFQTQFIMLISFFDLFALADHKFTEILFSCCKSKCWLCCWLWTRVNKFNEKGKTPQKMIRDKYSNACRHAKSTPCAYFNLSADDLIKPKRCATLQVHLLGK